MNSYIFSKIKNNIYCNLKLLNSLLKSRLNLFLFFLLISLFKNKTKEEKIISEISLEIIGDGKKIIINTLDIPSKVLINGIDSEVSDLSDYNLPSREINNITIQWDYPLTDCFEMFREIEGLTKVDLSKFDSSKVLNMSGMFYNCDSLASINFENFNTTSVEDMSNMFYNCEKLMTLDLESFNTQSLRSMNQMFTHCTRLISLNLYNFNTSLVNNIDYAFYYCQSLTSLNLSNFDTSLITNMKFLF